MGETGVEGGEGSRGGVFRNRLSRLCQFSRPSDERRDIVWGEDHHFTMISVSEMDLISNLLPAVPSLVLDSTSQYQNVTFLQEMFISAFLGTFIASLVGQTFRGILGKSR